MNKQENIKIKSGWWRLTPKCSQTAQALYPNIYLPREIYQDYSGSQPKPWTVSVVEHEATHLERQEKLGIWKWYVMYLLSPKFRINEELESIKKQMSILKKFGGNYPVEHGAKVLSGWMYLKAVNYDQAFRELQSAWKEA
jgi:hypothetical protein